jgi:hypothetical protein
MKWMNTLMVLTVQKIKQVERCMKTVSQVHDISLQA